MKMPLSPNDYISGACRADVENKRRLLRIRWMFLLDQNLIIFKGGYHDGNTGIYD